MNETRRQGESVVVRPLTPSLGPAFAALFDACASGCFCRYWDFPGTKNEWLARLAFEPGKNREEALSALESAAPTGEGFVALDGDAVVGWVKTAPRAALPKLRRLPVYRALDLGADDGVVSIACFLVHPSHRRRGVGRALLEAVIAYARASGARAVEAYPHRRDEALREEELWMGPLALFESLGFRSAGGNVAYPVERLAFEAAVSGE